MAEEELSRKSHVKRFFGKDPETDEDDENLWVDIECLDELESQQMQGPDYKRTGRKWWWNDGKGEDGNPSRKLSEKKIKIQHPYDDTQFIEIDDIEEIGATKSDFRQDERFWSKPGESGRKINVRRILHREMKEWDTEDIIDKREYKKKIIKGSEDKYNFVDFEFIEHYETQEMQKIDYMFTTIKLYNDPIFDEFKRPPRKAKKPPVRLNPLMNIVNIHWKPISVEVGYGIQMVSNAFEGPITCPIAEEETTVGVVGQYTTSANSHLEGPVHADDIEVIGGASGGSFSGSYGAWSQLSVNFDDDPGGTVQGSSFTAAVVGDVENGDNKCWGTPGLGGIYGATVGGEVGLGSVSFDASGLKVRYRGATWVVDHIAHGGTGQAIGIIVHFRPKLDEDEDDLL